MSKISVIVPVYNSEKYIYECIKSICNQSYKDIEIIVVDDGSTDSSYDVCKKILSEDDRIVLLSQENRGVSAARNYGINKASGEYITFVDSDDVIEVNHCECLVNNINEDIDMVVHGLKHFDLKKTEIIRHRIQKSIYTNSEFKKIIIDDGSLSGFTLHSSCSVLYKKKIIDEFNIRYREEIKYNEDGLFNVEYFFHTQKCVSVDFELATYLYRVNFSSASKNISNLLDKYTADMDEIQRVLLQISKSDSNLDLINQIKLRYLSVEISKFQILSSVNLKDLYAEVKKCIRNPYCREGLKLVNLERLNIKKKLLIILMKLNFRLIICLMFLIKK